VSLLSWLLVGSLAEPNPWPAPVLIDELDAGGFESTPDDIDGRAARLARTSFKLMHGYGALLELGQLWVPGRNVQLSDIGADLAGASIGVMVALVTMRLRRFAQR
jgi:hypothetical protein